jgi:putative sigma-54 modulation protein
MNISIRGDKLEVTSAIKDYVKEKLAKLDKYFEEPNKIDASVLLKVKNDIQSIEVTIPTNKYTLRAEEKNADMYAAIDLVVDVLERQIRKNKTRLNKVKSDDTVFAYFEEEEVEVPQNEIIKRKTIENKPMGEEEAILQMELLGHDFFVFKNVDEECTSVLYKRKDGNYGIINTK